MLNQSRTTINRGFRAAAHAYQPYLGRIATLLACACALSLFLYGVFLLEAVAHAASLASAEKQTRDIASQMSALEGQYLVDTQALTPEKAQALGFVTPAVVSTVVANEQSFSFVGR